MKPTLLLFFASALSLNTVAQSSIQVSNKTGSVVLAPNATVNVVTVPSDQVKVTIDIKNTGSSAKTYQAIKTEIQLNATPNATAAAYFCFAGSCFGTDTYTSGNLTLNPGQSASDIPGSNQMLEADLDEADVKGLSIVKYTFINVADPSDYADVTLQYNDATTSLAEQTRDRTQRYKLFPNPNSGGFMTISPAKAFEKVEVINILGAVVYSASGTSKVDLGGLAAGTYFVKIHHGEMVQTERLIITR